ncbi:MAG TPA: LemA family protein [Bacilli bacterium]|nr:LemA family protein [Bacilli bacterium]
MEILYIFLAISVCLFLFSLAYNTFSVSILKINEAEMKIDSSLRNTYDLLIKISNIIKSKLNTDKEVFDGISKIKDEKLSNFELDRKLLTYINELYIIKENYDELDNDEEFQKIFYEITDIEDSFKAFKDFYNDSIIKYNKLVSMFPMLIVAKIMRYKKKLFYDKKNMDDTNFKDFKL